MALHRTRLLGRTTLTKPIPVTVSTPMPRFAAFADGTVYVSDDARQWRLHQDTFGVQPVLAITVANDRFFAWGGRKLMTSADGLAWRVVMHEGAVVNRRNNLLWSPTRNEYLFLLGSRLYTSRDGETWTVRATNLPADSVPVGFAFGNGVYVAMTIQGATVDSPVLSQEPGHIYTSTDCITWTVRTSSGSNRSEAGLIFGGDRFVRWSHLAAHYNDNTNPNRSLAVHWSLDGLTWNVVPALTLNAAHTTKTTITYANGWFVAVQGKRIWRSPDAITWELTCDYGAGTPAQVQVTSLAYMASLGRWIAFSEKLSYHSVDALAWNVYQVTGMVATGIAANSGRLVLGTDLGRFYSSSNAIAYQETHASLPRYIHHAMAFRNRFYFAGGLALYYSGGPNGAFVEHPALNVPLTGGTEYRPIAKTPTRIFVTKPNGLYYSPDGLVFYLLASNATYEEILFWRNSYVALDKRGYTVSVDHDAEWPKPLKGETKTTDIKAIAASPSRLAADGYDYVQRPWSPDFTQGPAWQYRVQRYHSVNWGYTWHPLAPEWNWRPNKLIYGAGRFVNLEGYGTTSEVALSTEANESPVRVNVLPGLLDVAYDEGSAAPVSQSEQIYNSWRRFSHGAAPTYPNNPAEVNSWIYSAAADRVLAMINSSTVIGFVSNSQEGSYVHSAQLSSNNTDDDHIGIVIGFVTEGVPGQPGFREHTLMAIRSNNAVFRWRIYYNFGQADAWIVQNGDSRITRAFTNPGFDAVGSVSQGWLDAGVGCPIRIERVGDIVRCQTGAMATTTLLPSTELTVNLASDPRLAKFRGLVRYGYACQSQLNATFSNIQFSAAGGVPAPARTTPRQFVAVGRQGGWATSPDAQTWTTRPPFTTLDLYCVAINVPETLEGLQWAPGCLWTFDGTSLKPWSGIGGINSVRNSVLRHTTTKTGAVLASPPGLNLNGSIYNRIVMRLRRVAGNPVWVGGLSYGVVGRPTRNPAFRKTIAQPNLMGTQQFDTIVWDMSDTDYAAGIVTQIWFELATGINAAFEIDYIMIGTPAT